MAGNAKTAAGRPAEEIITKLAQHIDYFNKYSQPHSTQMADLAAKLATRLGLLRLDIDAIVEAAMLHDIGLYEMAPVYVFNPGPLSPDQRMDLWRHSIIGEQSMAKRNASRHSQLLVRWHHEWWNGTGYPDMLCFEEIPIGARVLHAVELYCALIANRPYRLAFTHELALELVRASAGVQCDPFVVRELLALLEEADSQAAEDVPVRDVPGEPAGTEYEAPEYTASSEPAATANPPATPVPAGPEQRPTPNYPAMPEQTAMMQPSVTPERAATSEYTATPERAGSREHTSTFERTVSEQAPPPQPSPARDLRAPDAGWRPAIWPPQPEPHAAVSKSRPEPTTAGERQRADGVSRGWRPSPYIMGSMLGFQVSVLRQIDFRTIAIPFCGWAELVWYLAALGKQVLANDPRPWGAVAARAVVESEALNEEQVFTILQDTYIPGVRMSNPELRRWFGEADAWWMDNLRRKALEEPAIEDQVLLLGMRAGDYAQSFAESTRELKRPLTVIFRELARNKRTLLTTHPHNRAYNLPVQQFLRDARADLMYLSLPSGQAEFGGPLARSAWHNAWILGRPPDVVDDFSVLSTLPQSKKAYLEMVDRMLVSGSRIRKWAIECRDIGLASARDISDLIKNHRTIQATYSKDLTEVPGGLRNYVMIAELPNREG